MNKTHENYFLFLQMHREVGRGGEREEGKAVRGAVIRCFVLLRQKSCLSLFYCFHFFLFRTCCQLMHVIFGYLFLDITTGLNRQIFFFDRVCVRVCACIVIPSDENDCSVVSLQGLKLIAVNAISNEQ